MDLAQFNLRWGYTFLLSTPKLSAEEKFDLIRQATEMYLAGEEKRTVKTDEYDGVLYTERRFEVMGNFSGVRFDAELQTNDDKLKLRFLVSEQTGGKGIAYTNN